MRNVKKNKYTVAVVGCGKVGALYSAEKGRPASASHAGAAASHTKTELVALVDTNAKALARAVDRGKTVFVLNYQRRFSPLFERTRAAIASGALGRVQQATCYYSNGLYNNGGHALDALLQLLGDGMAVRFSRVNKKAAHPPGDPCIDAVLETKKGARIVLQSLDQKAYGIFDILLLCTRGERALLDYGSTLVETRARTSIFEGVRQLDRARASSRRGDPQGTLAYAVACLERGTPPSSGVKNGVQVVELLEKIKNYARKNK